jgi:hypothetical protein
MLMDGIDVLARLYTLRDELGGLSEDDKTFVNEMVKLHESGQVLNRHQILRIVEMRVPGEPAQQESQDARIWTQEKVNIISGPPEEVIWRYMPLEQLFALLWKKALHFSPLAVMDDKSEGELPSRAWEETKKKLPQDILDGKGCMDAETMMAIMVAQRRTDACINCWYINGSDSLDMWHEFAPKNGVAIQSTVRRLASCFWECQTPITIGPVTYFAPEEEDKYTRETFYGSLYIKHKPFQYQRELRALAYRVNIGGGVDIPVKVEVLIERLALSPELPDWAVPVIKDTLRRYGFAGCIEKSTLSG